MDDLFQPFYKKTYVQTNGFVPVTPVLRNVHPGDFFQIKNGQFFFLGNIFNPAIVDLFEVKLAYDIQLNPDNWSFSEGVSKPYTGRGSGQDPLDQSFEYSRQVLSFKEKGSFLFQGNNPVSARIQNWNEIQNELIIKLTQAYYSFREVFVVTESVALDNWKLAVAGAENAELEIALSQENMGENANYFGLTDIFGHHASKTIQTRDLEYYKAEQRKCTPYFKAKKLIVKNDQVDVFISDLITKRNEHQKWAQSFFPYDLHYVEGLLNETQVYEESTNVLDLLQGSQLNPKTALDYFSWRNMNMDDVQKLFSCHA